MMKEDTVTNATVRHNVILHLSKVSAAQGNSGPQWELEGDVSALPGEPGNWGDWPPRFWIDADGPQPELGYYRCVIERGKKKKDAYSGDIEFHYRWKMVSFNNTPHEPQPVTEQPAQPSGTVPQGIGGVADVITILPESDAARRDRTTRRSIERQVALKAAVELVIAYPPPKGDQDGAITATISLAGIYYGWLSHTPEPTEAQAPASEPAPEEEGQDPGERTPWGDRA
jgi:hypothetical protein